MGFWSVNYLRRGGGTECIFGIKTSNFQSETAKAQNSFDLFFRNSNGACDHQLNSPECMYDGGDCCVPLIFDRFCSYPLCQCRADRTQHSFCKYLPINLIPIILYSAGLLTL